MSPPIRPSHLVVVGAEAITSRGLSVRRPYSDSRTHPRELVVHPRSENASCGLMVRLFSAASSRSGLEASPVGSTALQACELLRPRPGCLLQRRQGRYLVWSKPLLHGDSCKSERKKGSIRPPPRWSKQLALRYREQDVRIVVADAVDPVADSAPLEGAVMGFPRQLE